MPPEWNLGVSVSPLVMPWQTKLLGIKESICLSAQIKLISKITENEYIYTLYIVILI